MIKAVIFDMDGVLIDSEEFIAAAAVRYFSEQGISVSREDFTPFVGAGENRYIGGVAEKYGIAVDIDEAKKRTYEIYGEMLEGRASPLPGALDFISKARKKGLKLGVASSADRVKIDINLREIGIPEMTFDVIVSGLDVVNKKPDPEIFLKAAEMLEVSPSEALVVEDAVNGVIAAKEGGFKCLGILTSFSEAELKGADWFSKNLAEAPDECLEW